MINLHVSNFFKKRWQNEDLRIQLIIEAIQNNTSWSHLLLDDLDLDLSKLQYCELFHSSFDSTGRPRDLRGVTMRNVVISHSNRLSNTCLDYCLIDNVQFRHCTIINSTFRFSEFKDVSFYNCKLKSLNFYEASIDGIEINGQEMDQETYFLDQFNFYNASTTRYSFIPASFKNTKFNSAYPIYFPSERRTSFSNPKTHVMVTPESRNDFNDFLQKEEKYYYLSLKHPLFSRLIFTLTARFTNFARLFGFILSTWLFFGALYSPIPSSFLKSLGFNNLSKAYSQLVTFHGLNTTPQSLSKLFEDLADSLYFSAVTITTLGYGDIYPTSPFAKMLIILETFHGLVFFGFFISTAFLMYTDE